MARIFAAAVRGVLVAAVALMLGIGSAVGQEEDDDARVDARDIERARQVLAAPAPQGASSQELARASMERVRAARMLQQPQRELEEINAGLSAVGPESRFSIGLYNALAEYQGDRGDGLATVRAREQALMILASAGSMPGQELSQEVHLVAWYTILRDRPAAIAMLSRAQQTLQRLRPARAWPQYGELWQAKVGLATAQYERSYGSFSASEAASRACIASMRSYLDKSTDVNAGESAYFLVNCTAQLVQVLLRSGRLDDAAALSVELQELARDYGRKQGRAAFAQRLAPAIVQVAIERGRFDQAEAFIDAAIAQQLAQRASEGSAYVSTLRWQRAAIAAIQGNWQQADTLFAERRAALLVYPEQAQRLGVASPEWGYALLRLGQPEKALDMLNRVVESRMQRFGPDAYFTYEARGFRAIALAANGKRNEALQEFAAVVPRIAELSHAERVSEESGVMRTVRLNWIFEGYLAALADTAVKGERPANLDPADEAFRLADLIRGSTVQNALSQAASRAVIGNPDLAELARRYHAQQREIGTLSDGLGNLLARGRVASMDEVVTRIRNDLETLRRDQARVRQDIERRFPDYASLIEPKAPGIAEVQRLLRPGEVLLSLLTGTSQSYVWAIPREGQAQFAVVPVSAKQAARQVSRLRHLLDPTSVEESRRIPAYDFETAYALYKQFVGPVAAGLEGAKSLMVVAHGELTQLPFAALVSEPFSSPATAPNFEGYADAPWLAKRFAVSQLPSATSLVALRREAKANRPERAFVAFGDPVFSRDPAKPAKQRGLTARNLPLAAVARPDERSGPAAMLKLLQPLPETAEEVREIGRLLGADEERDLYLGARASERNVKAADLTRYRAVMFATHGLLPGNLPGLSQPALALSDPGAIGDAAGEDGLLMLDEILGLRLQADWVVLSACHTAAPDPLSAEAVSGIGRAFFFAGTRSLLVTGWPIETESARLLTAAIFRIQRDKPERSRAGALRDASLEVMRQNAPRGGLTYAHPMFWAPFMLIGDGG